jgi:predicted CXXCH cytochrome family protein
MTGKLPRNIFWGGLMIGLGLLLMAGCGTPRERYRVLSFFFDGVPNPDAVKPASGNTGAVAQEAARVVKQHKPYAENNCAACHRTAAGNIQEFSEAYKQCVKCHPNVPRERRLMHGPVAREACRWCHAPHESTEPALLKEAPVKVCTQCHDRQLLGDHPPEHVDGTTSCLRCHFGHGGNARYFLTPPAAAATIPASPTGGGPFTAPASTPALNLAPTPTPSTAGAPATAAGKERSP